MSVMYDLDKKAALAEGLRRELRLPDDAQFDLSSIELYVDHEEGMVFLDESTECSCPMMVAGYWRKPEEVACHLVTLEIEGLDDLLDLMVF